MLLLLIASSNVMVIIIGTSLEGKLPGTAVPSSEQKQSGNKHTSGSHGGARFGSLSMSKVNNKQKNTRKNKNTFTIQNDANVNYDVL